MTDLTAAVALPEPGRPVQPAERIELLDVLRGFALLGILLVNWGSNYLDVGALRRFCFIPREPVPALTPVPA